MSEDRRHGARRDEDRSGLSDSEWRKEVDTDLKSLGRAVRAQTRATQERAGRIAAVETSVIDLKTTVEDLGVSVREHTPISVEDGAYLTILRGQYPIPTMARLTKLGDRLEAQWTSQEQAEAARQKEAERHWDIVKQLIQFVLGGILSLCVFVIGLLLEQQRVISLPVMVAGALVLLCIGLFGYVRVTGKLQHLQKGNTP